MKRFCAILIMSTFAIMAIGQTCDIPLQVFFQDELDGMTQQNANYVKNLIQRVLVQGNGIGSIENSRFGVVVRSDVVDKHIISGAPSKTILNISLSLYVGDVKEGNLYSSYSIELNGIGDNTNKAYSNAFRKLNANNKDLVQFAEQGKKKIIEFYDRNYQNIIKNAKALASLRNYEEALYNLMSIPECCVGYDLAMQEVVVIFKQFVNRQCEENLAQAQAAWMAGYNREAAAVASVFLSEIYPDAACYSTAQELVQEIKKHMNEEWKFELKRWDDMISVEMQQIKYAREVAVAFAQNQPQQITHLFFR